MVPAQVYQRRKSERRHADCVFRRSAQHLERQPCCARLPAIMGSGPPKSPIQNTQLSIDLNELIAKRYEAMGAEKVKELFYGDHTHTNPEGARVNAAIVVER